MSLGTSEDVCTCRVSRKQGVGGGEGEKAKERMRWTKTHELELNLSAIASRRSFFVVGEPIVDSAREGDERLGFVCGSGHGRGGTREKRVG